jgi:hypothetical protein
MSRPRAAFVLPVLFVTCAAVACHADAFDDFRIPDNRASLWTGTVRASGAASGTSQSLGEDRRASAATMLSSKAWWRSDADARSTSLSFSVSVNGSRQGQELEPRDASLIPYAFGSESHGRSLGQDVSGGIDHRRYFAGGPWCVTGQLFASGGYKQEWSTSRDRVVISDSDYQTSRDTASAWSYDNDVKLTFGVGAGHVRNATGVYEARVLERRLSASGALTRPLSAQARTQLASLLYARTGLDVVHDHPAVPLWGAIERILRADGALRDSGVTAGEWFRSVEPYFARSTSFGPDLAPASPVVRLRGCNAGIVLQLLSEHRLERHRDAHTVEVVTGGIPAPGYRGASYERHRSSYDLALAGVQAEGHWPLNESVQLDVTGSIVTNIRPHRKGIQEITNASAAWMLAERWLVTARLAHVRTTNYPDVVGSWAVMTDGAATYFVADHLDASLRVSAQRVHSEYGSPMPYWITSGRGDFSFQFTYRFAGFAVVPSLAPFLTD